MNPDEIRAALIEARRVQGLTQHAVGELLGLSRAAVSLKEAGRRPIFLDEFFVWCEVLKVPLTVELGETASDHEELANLLLRLLDVLPLPSKESVIGFLRVLEQQHLTVPCGEPFPLADKTDDAEK